MGSDSNKDFSEWNVFKSLFCLKQGDGVFMILLSRQSRTNAFPSPFGYSLRATKGGELTTMDWENLGLDCVCFNVALPQKPNVPSFFKYLP
jgi:hypothetical protein